MTYKGKPNVRGTKPLMIECAKCGKKFHKVIMGQKLCKECMKRRENGAS